MSATKNINKFLGAVDLQHYRDKYARIKLVELDMPRNIQPIKLLYREYWDKRKNYPSFDEFYQTYAGELGGELDEFREETMFSSETFHRGLPARIYRTWASLLTQIQGGYAAEEMYGAGSVEMSAALDYGGIDIRINTGARAFDIQVKKETVSREVRAPSPWMNIERKGNKIARLTYEVPGEQFTKTGKERTPFARWRKRWEGKLARLDNGFIIFLPAIFSRENLEKCMEDS